MIIDEITTREPILKAIKEFDQLGRDEFLRQNGFGPAQSYWLIYDHKSYDSKAIVGVAYGFLPNRNRLRAMDFHGGPPVKRRLEKLSFQVNVDTVETLRIPAEAEPSQFSDAVDDLGTDTPGHVNFAGVRYARDKKIRDTVKRRADGKCELCGELRFICSDGTRYLECHHIIALANDGADQMTNVIALCPGHHCEAHFGESARRAELEKEMMSKVEIAERRAA